MAAQPLLALSGAAIWRVGLLASGVLEALALGGILALFTALAWRGPALRSRTALWSVLPLFALAYGALALAAVVNLLNVMQAASQVAGGAPAGLIPPPGDELNVTLGLFGVLVPIALAMSARSLPMYAGLQPFPQQILWPAAAVYLVGLLLSAIGAAMAAPPGILTGLGQSLMGAMLLLVVIVFVRMIRARGRLPTRIQQLAPAPDSAARSYQARLANERTTFGPYVALVASAYLWALLGGALLVLDGLALVLGAPAPVALDAVRHALAIGFIALLICGIAPRMVPGFSSGRITSPRLVTATLWLGNAAAVLRVGSVLVVSPLAALGVGGPTVSTIAFGLSGPLGLALAICLAANLWPALQLSKRRIGS
jgi:uncharacterized protein involved in response to NO